MAEETEIIVTRCCVCKMYKYKENWYDQYTPLPRTNISYTDTYISKECIKKTVPARIIEKMKSYKDCPERCGG